MNIVINIQKKQVGGRNKFYMKKLILIFFFVLVQKLLQFMTIKLKI